MYKESFKSLVKDYKAVFLDSYGVLKNYNGMVPGAQETLNFIKRQGIAFKVLTNDASRSQIRQAEGFERIGLKGIEPKDIITSGMMAKAFLENKVKNAKVAYLGTKQASEYILAAQLESIPIRELDLDDIEDIAALVFLDDEGFDWNQDINKTVNLLRKANIPAIVANSDKLYPVAKNDVAIATGGVAQLVESILGREFIQFGKPDSQMFMHAFEQINQEGKFSRQDILMVGDTLHTDILGGNKFGLRTVLVLTGNTRAGSVDIKVRSTGVYPDYICDSIAT